MDRADLLSGLSQHLPRFVDQVTPDGRLPTEEEAARIPAASFAFAICDAPYAMRPRRTSSAT